ncbi:hypothetical protein PR048_016130 [Dryococelus australis]|uniref:Uncharacterized protein n=1 Tax=Dryococelus australis TaxID=614101 RepID=A0ABQ9HK18_9NEOP|nr:hypothetical protein PR048_016130 [Dryococelus australis]
MTQDPMYNRRGGTQSMKRRKERHALVRAEIADDLVSTTSEVEPLPYSNKAVPRPISPLIPLQHASPLDHHLGTCWPRYLTGDYVDLVEQSHSVVHATPEDTVLSKVPRTSSIVKLTSGKLIRVQTSGRYRASKLLCHKAGIREDSTGSTPRQREWNLYCPYPDTNQKMKYKSWLPSIGSHYSVGPSLVLVTLSWGIADHSLRSTKMRRGINGLESIVKPPISSGFTYVTTCHLLYTPNSMTPTLPSDHHLLYCDSSLHTMIFHCSIVQFRYSLHHEGWRLALASMMCGLWTAAQTRKPISLLASHQGDPGSIPGRVTPDFRMWESCQTMLLASGFSLRSPVSPTLSFRHCSILTSITLICSQDLDVKSHPNLFTSPTDQYSVVVKRTLKSSTQAELARWCLLRSTREQACNLLQDLGIVYKQWESHQQTNCKPD